MNNLQQLKIMLKKLIIRLTNSNLINMQQMRK